MATHVQAVSSVPSGAPNLGLAKARAPAWELQWLGTGSAMMRVHALVEQSAANDLPVLITGEVGVGTDRVAREIHRRSARAREALVELHCASLPNDFFESRLLGHEPSLRLTTDRSPRSPLDSTSGGTLLLHDIGELSTTLQDRLLQVLQRGESADARRTAFRVIGTTHRDLTRAMETGAFSEDLFYRINLMHIRVPALREHREDIPVLLQHFVQEHAERERWQGELPESLLARFRSYDWPGNVFELENAMRRFMALRDPVYVMEELEAQSQRRARLDTNAAANVSTPSVPTLAPHDAWYSVDLKELGRRASDAAEKAAIVDMLSRTDGDKKLAAQRLGISYKALLYKIHDFGIAESRSSKGHSASTQGSSSA